MEESVPEAENLLFSREVAEKDKDKETQEDEEEEKVEANGGILNNLISNLMGATTTTVDGESGENIKKSECEDEDEDEKKRESSGAGILEKIISHFPEDAAPTTEEASILIHSVID
ncbi:unnamed protein product [Microthlaspi erraticum]|uniref:Uncharacterized protein n=1 Tax=Microthlaspi erraticum TaxID=1685480 RepID=A0A6D2HV09_9BRAS|nr:unnamed protein product [Microthlaspi erraticum]